MQQIDSQTNGSTMNMRFCPGASPLKHTLTSWHKISMGKATVRGTRPYAGLKRIHVQPSMDLAWSGGTTYVQSGGFRNPYGCSGKCINNERAGQGKVVWWAAWAPNRSYIHEQNCTPVLFVQSPVFGQ